MAKYSGWKKRYSYLDDYKPGMDGKYVYYGRHYIFQGTGSELKKYKWTLGLADFVFLALFIVSGIMDAGAIWRSVYVIIPFMVEAIAIFLFIWKTLTMIVEKNPIKAYLYKKSVPWFRPTMMTLVIACLISICMTILCMLLTQEGIKVTGCILYMLLKLLSAAAAFFLFRHLAGCKWELDPSEEMQ